MTGTVAVAGPGVGSLTAATLLARRGWHVSARDQPARPRPVLVLNEVALALLDDVWGPGVVSDGHPITQRRVRWGADEREASVPVRACAIEGGLLVERLLERFSPDPGDEPPACVARTPSTAWVIDATRSSAVERVTFGRRCVVQAEVGLADADWSTASVETVPDGWVHLAPVAEDRGVVQCMVASPPDDPAATMARMIGAAGGIVGRVGPPAGAVAVFGAAPTLAIPACRPGWISVADGAVSLDPLSGLGAAWALRGGILAAAVVDGVSSGLGERRCLDHYEARLREALHAHVEHCLTLYGAALTTPAWQEELDLMARALDRDRRRRPPAAFDLRLNGLHLEPRTPAAR